MSGEGGVTHVSQCSTKETNEAEQMECVQAGPDRVKEGTYHQINCRGLMPRNRQA